MKRKGNLVTLVLMISSVALLVLLEILWLVRSYEKEVFDFRRETSFLLRNTLGELRDSLIFENIQWLHNDSTSPPRPVPLVDSLTTITRIQGLVRSDSTNLSKSTVRVYISSPSDSLRSDIIKPLLRRIGEPSTDEKTDRTFILRVNDDSLDSKKLETRFMKALEKQDLPRPERVERVGELPEEIPLGALKKRRRMIRTENANDNPQNTFSDEMTTESVAYSPMVQYHASFRGIRKYMISRLAPELLFSFFVTALTCGAFFLVYQNLRRQQRLVELKDAFISNITHELKTPVATVGVAIEAMKSFSAMDKPQLTREYLDIALKEVNRLVSMTDNILNTSVLEIEKGTIPKELVDLKLLSEDVISSMNLLAAAHSNSITFETEGSYFFIEGEPTLLSNTLTNLIDNAIKYAGTDARVLVSLRDVGYQIIVSVKDNGPGIDPVFHQQIFEKFFRVPKGDIHTVKGHGLGLNYVRSVVRLHKGTINVTSAPEKGSVFTIKFPTPRQRS